MTANNKRLQLERNITEQIARSEVIFSVLNFNLQQNRQFVFTEECTVLMQQYFDVVNLVTSLKKDLKAL